MTYRLYRSDTGVLIRTDAGEIELSAEDAARLGTELVPRIAPQSRDNRPWTAEEDARLRQMVAQKTPLRDIAKFIGRTKPAIACRRKVLGILTGSPKQIANTQLARQRLAAKRSAAWRHEQEQADAEP
jgi:hypothetical protein